MRSNALIVLILGVALGAGLFAGCSPLDVLSHRPLLDSSGQDISLDPVVHTGDTELANLVREEIRTGLYMGPRHSIEWVEEGGDLRIAVEILAINRSPRTETFAAVCHRDIPGRFQEMCDENGRCERVPVREEYPCDKTDTIEDASARFKVQLLTTHGAKRFEHVYHVSVDGSPMARKVLATRLAEQVVRLIAPWFYNPRVDRRAFSDECLPGSTRCREAGMSFLDLRFKTAEKTLDEEIGRYSDRGVPVTAEDAPAIGRALCNRGLAREYQMKLSLALSDYKRAAFLAPNRHCASLMERLSNYLGARDAFTSKSLAVQ